MFVSKDSIKLILVLILFSSPFLSAQVDFNWAKGWGLLSTDIGDCVTADASGNIYLTGEFSQSVTGPGTLTFPSGVTMTSQGNVDYFLVKFDNSGNALWARTGGSGAAAYTERGLGVTTDNLGNVITGGEYMRTTTFTGGSNPNVVYTALGINTDGFVAKYNTSGDLLWVRSQSDFQQEFTYKVATDPSNNIIGVGYFGSLSGGIGYDTLKLPDPGYDTVKVFGTPSRDWYIVKYDPNGHVLWGMSAGNSAYNDECKNVTTDASGNIYVCGTGIGDPFIIGGVTLHLDTLGLSTNTAITDIIVAKISPAGNVMWAKNFGGKLPDAAYGIACDGLGHLYVSGNFDSVATFGSLGNVTANGGNYYDAFLLKMDTDGNPLWIRTGGQPLSATETAYNVTIDKAGNPWITGAFSGTATFSGQNITSAGGDDIFIAKYDPSGNLLALKRAGATSTDQGLVIAAEPNGNVVVTGKYSATPDFGTTTLSNVGGTDFFLTEIGGRVSTLTAFIQGLTNGGGTAMTNDVNPITVTVELHNSTSPYALVESQTGVLSTAGVGTFNFTTATDGTPYYVVVKSANTIETWSATAVSFTSGALSYNFTSAASQAYGSNMVQIGSKWCIYSGDVNADGLVDSGDLGLIDNDYSNYQSGPGWVTDVNGDGVVDSGDLGITDNNYSNYISAAKPFGAPAKHLTRQVPQVKSVIK